MPARGFLEFPTNVEGPGWGWFVGSGVIKGSQEGFLAFRLSCEEADSGGPGGVAVCRLVLGAFVSPSSHRALPQHRRHGRAAVPISPAGPAGCCVAVDREAPVSLTGLLATSVAVGCSRLQLWSCPPPAGAQDGSGRGALPEGQRVSEQPSHAWSLGDQREWRP